jgi:hypothetical protein
MRAVVGTAARSALDELGSAFSYYCPIASAPVLAAPAANANTNKKVASKATKKLKPKAKAKAKPEVEIAPSFETLIDVDCNLTHEALQDDIDDLIKR